MYQDTERRKYRMEGGPTTAAGDRVGMGDIAVPSNIPLGSKIYIPGYGWGVARDHGGAIRGNRIDLAFGGVNAAGTAHNPEAEKKANAWGRKSVQVYVFPASYQIPTDKTPPQAYLNDVANHSKKVATATTLDNKQVSIPVKNNVATKKVAPAAIKTPKLPPETTQENKAFYAVVDHYKNVGQLYGQNGKLGNKNPNAFQGWDQTYAQAYVDKAYEAANNAYKTADGWEKGRSDVAQIKEAVKYWVHKKKINGQWGQWASDMMDQMITNLTPTGKLQPNNSAEPQVQNTQNNINLPNADQMRSSNAVNNEFGNAGTPTSKEIRLSDVGAQIAVDPPKFSQRSFATTIGKPVNENRPSISPAPELSNSQVPPGESKSLSQVVRTGQPTSKSIAIPSASSSLTETVRSAVPTLPDKPENRPNNTALTSYIHKINETDKIKSDSVKGVKQYAAAAKSFNDVRRSIDSSGLSQEQKAKLRQIQGAYPYKG